MSIIIHTLVLFLLLVTASCGNQPLPKNDLAAGQPETTGTGQTENKNAVSPYLLGPGDELSIKVWRHDDLNRSLKVDPAGNIQFPLVGEMSVSGLTLMEFRTRMAGSLAKYVVSPSVDISLLSAKNLVVYVLGEVSKPGSYEWRTGMPIWDGIAKAGGFSANANDERILLVSAQNDRIVVSAVNFKDILKGGSSQQDFILKNGDIVYVLPTTIADIQTFMNRLTNIIAPIINIESGILLYPEMLDVLQGETSSGTIIVPR